MIKTERSSLITTISLNRPEVHNALSPALIDELVTSLLKAQEDMETRVIILRAEGKSFCAGADLHWMKSSATFSRNENIEDAKKISRLMETLNTLSKPTICLVQGAAYGGGVGLLACCDLVIAASTAEVCFSEVKIGLIPAVISPYVIQKIGSYSRRYFITAEMISAKRAYEIGLVDEVVDKEQLDKVGQLMAQKILKNSPAAVCLIKQLTKDFLYPQINLEAGIQTIEAIADCRASKQGQEGLQAFLEKRKPTWL